jgi:phage terminase large subunit-like protein
MGTRLQRDGVVKTRPFPQGADRLEADKQLLDLVVQRRLFHDGNAMLREHVDNADKKVDAETRKLRIVKREESKKIDAVVCLSMSAYRCLKLPL